MSTVTRTANDLDYPAIDQLYAEWGKAFPHSIDDQVFVTEYEGNIIAALRLSFENSVFVLRSLYVKKEFRGCGAAKQLLDMTAQEIGLAEAFCITPNNLHSLFELAGFQKIAGLTAPGFLTARRDSLRESSGDVILMKRNLGVEVRPITVDDLEPAMSLIREFQLPEVQSLSNNDIRGIYSKITANGGAVIGAFRGTSMIGTCTINVCANLSWSGRPYGIIENIIVTDKERNKGIGKYLLLFSKHFAASRNCYKVALMTRDNNIAETSFYTSVGFSDDRVGYEMQFGA